jgi:hypothetical protein
MQMEQANPLRLAGIYNGVSGSLVGQVPYGYVNLHVFGTIPCRILSIVSYTTLHLYYHCILCVYTVAHRTHIIICCLYLDAYSLTTNDI